MSYGHPDDPCSRTTSAEQEAAQRAANQRDFGGVSLERETIGLTPEQKARWAELKKQGWLQ